MEYMEKYQSWCHGTYFDDQTKKELEAIEKQRQTQRQLRKHHQEKVVCLVGYTNSGKSSLLNHFTKKKVDAKDMLFASLENT